MLTRSASLHGTGSDFYVSARSLNNSGQRSGSLTAAAAPSSGRFQESTSSSSPQHRSTPESPSPSSTLGNPAASRKRGQSVLDLDERNTTSGSSSRPHVEPIQTWSPKGEHICLCTPAPKIRRPRNAFILYRTHHQAKILAENPCLPNPEISKIIGFQWRDEPESVKETWKRLAEEDKRKHARLYPNYKFQPRRGGKPGSAARTSSLSEGADPSHCANCGGRSITTPSTPSLPTSVSTPVAMSHKMAGGPHGNQSTYPPLGRAGPEHTYHGARLFFGDEREAMSSPSKRPRLGSDGGYYHHPMPSPPPPQQQQQPQSPYTSGPARTRYEQQNRHPSAVLRQTQSYGNPADKNGYPPPPGQQSQPQQYRGAMAPPPPPQPTALRPSLGFGPDRRPTASQPKFDESLRLPPLQSRAEPQKHQQAQPSLQQKPQELPVSQHHHARQPSTSTAPPALVTTTTTTAISQREIEARSVEAMVMSIPYVNKLQVLERISPPLAPPGPSSPAVETRGPVMAIEGSHPDLMEAVGRVMQRVLEESRECVVRTWSDGKPPAMAAGDHAMEEQPHDGDASTPGGDRTPRAGEKRAASAAVVVVEDNASDALEAANSVAESDAEMSDAPSISRRKSSSDESTTQQPGGLSTFLPYLGKIQEWHRRSDEMIRFVTTKPLGSGGGRDNKTPVALITDGFSLHISDWFASRVSITDAYAPVDHWQWMATLWRGIVGPDLVVYVRKSKAEDIRAFGAVEVKSPRLIVVRVDPPAGEMQPRLSESMERRVGFEIMEWVRGGSFRQGF
ncbi:hypothetical protein MCOR25_004513 [Pyricularia grisea]|nr:hypothetical protein MCOR25_004513 [Pyricularia grisea]